MRADLDDGERSAATLDGFAGTTRSDASVESQMTLHSPAFGDMLHSHAVIGPEVGVPANASAQDRLLAKPDRLSQPLQASSVVVERRRSAPEIGGTRWPRSE